MRRLGSCLLLLLPALAAVGQGGMHHGRMPHDAAHASMVRHRYVRDHGLDTLYAGKRRPRQPTTEDLASGRDLLALHCASCHGEQGVGDGEAGAALSPPPANLAAAVRRPIATDSYLFWTIAEGGVPVGSAMPPFKGVLAEDAVWQIIAYLREL